MTDSWTIDSNVKKSEKQSSEEYLRSCDVPCHTRTSCENCTHGSCMWCSSLKQCIESNAYSAIYPIGQCMEWTTHPSKCPLLTCSDIQSCSKCLSSPRCGWCDNGSGTGVGVCLEGGSRGPFAINSTHKVLEAKRCPSNWYFSSCPSCECNGHSRCLPHFPSKCIECNNHTEGTNCEKCRGT